MSDQQGTSSSNRKQQSLTVAMLLWFLIVAGFFLWQTVEYRGIAALAGEWEYQRFGTYFPWATLLLLVGLFCIPPIYFLLRREKTADDHVPTLVEYQRKGRRQLSQLTIAAIICLAAAAVSLGLVLTLPSGKGQPARVVASADATPRNGPTTLAGRIRYDRIATLERHLLLAERTFYFAPIEPAAGQPLRYFVEFAELPSATSGSATYQGVLRDGGLPGDIVHLYRDAGYRVDPSLHVLFSSETAMRWPFYVIALHFLLVSIVLGVAGLFQRRRIKRMPMRWRDGAAAEAAPAQ
jgi:hypothetical protein